MRILAATIFISLLFPSVSLADGDILSALQTKMKFLNQRQSVISHNIANADTPGYKARDLAPVDFSKAGKTGSVKLMTTNPGHVGGRSAGVSFKTVKQKDTYETTLNGNNVVLEEQMVKMADNDMEYQKVVGITRQMNGLMRTAVGGNR